MVASAGAPSHAHDPPASSVAATMDRLSYSYSSCINPPVPVNQDTVAWVSVSLSSSLGIIHCLYLLYIYIFNIVFTICDACVCDGVVYPRERASDHGGG